LFFALKQNWDEGEAKHHKQPPLLNAIHYRANKKEIIIFGETY
jgi:hypothetical protein